MRRHICLYCIAALLTLFVATSCSIKIGHKRAAVVTGRPVPPPHAPAHGVRHRYMYRYYPSSHVYFDVERKLYFYLEGDNWKVGVELPADIEIKVNEAVSLSLETDRPYLYFQEHKVKYPPGQLKK